MACTNDDEALQQWPVECRDDALQYLKTSHQMVTKLLEALLGNLGVELDDSNIDAFIGKKMVNMNFYPTCPNPELTVGVGRHSDMGTLTILLQDGIGGLYVKVPEEADMENKGEWVEIPPIPEHRVRTTSTKSRVSIPIFVSPQATQRIAPFPQVVEKDGVARYREFVFADYMNSFFGNAHDGYSLLSAVIAAVPRPSTMPRAWTFFLLDQILTYLILGAAAVSTEVLYLANKGDSAITWSAACGSFAGFCHKATTSVIITFVTVLCYVVLSLVSSYRLFTKFDAPVNYTSKTIETTVFHG
ncbi:hypothetical protein V6N13_049977 [Hibiscus sabdariffa]